MVVMNANEGKSSLATTGTSSAATTSQSPSEGFLTSFDRTGISQDAVNTAIDDDFLSFGVAVDAGRVPLWPLNESKGRELELMHHYSTYTCNTLALREDMKHVWRVVIPREGYSHPFVMDGILALSALHKAYLIPSDREAYLTIAAHHQSLGLEGFRPLLTNVTEQNWKPVFCYATVVALYVCLLPARSDKGQLSAPVANTLEMIRFVRGIRSVLQPFIEHLPRSNFAPLAQGVWIVQSCEISDYDPPLEQSLLPRDTFDALRRLGSFFRHDPQLTAPQDYEAAVSELMFSAKLMASAGLHIECGMVLSWPYVLPASILADIQELNPYALVLLSYFSAFLAIMGTRFWVLEGWGTQLLKDIEALLKDLPPFHEILTWPKEQVSRLNGIS
ncbi:Putative fungal transcription factor [Colletotrichum destructivum]|uniref:Fungal transcription factor n=1 Tax=Colletotrichum destructivum TaxID=34406 RepID=A0AAX4J492_9PEZI|nr:Putative fungal transcription factor [Colletotrichum destructivum]